MVTKATGMFRFASKDQLDAIAKISALAAISFEAAVALQLCRETLRDYCPPEEETRVIAILVGTIANAAKP